MTKFKYQKIYGKLSGKLIPLYEIFKSHSDAEYWQRELIDDETMKLQIKELNHIIKSRKDTIISQIETITLKPFYLSHEVIFVEKLIPPYHSISRPLMIDFRYSGIEQFYIYLQAIIRHQLLIYYPDIHKTDIGHILFTSFYSRNGGEIEILHMRGLIIAMHIAEKRGENQIITNMYKDRGSISIYQIHQKYIQKYGNESVMEFLQTLIKDKQK